MNLPAQWTELSAQKLVRYEALLTLLNDIQGLDDIELICRRAAIQWKYCANVGSFRLVVAHDRGYRVVDGYRGDARVADVTVLSDWDAWHWTTMRPRRLPAGDRTVSATPPEHLTGTAIAEIEVMPLVRAGHCIALLSAAARHQPFDDLDDKFVRFLGIHLAERIHDILLRRKAIEALVSKATRDALTGLLNRGAIVDSLGSQIALARRTGLPLALILADIDHFKAINDTLGHGGGDEVLVEVARRLQAQTRNGDHLGRVGGEEFLFVLYPCGPEEVAEAAERLRRAICDEPFAGRAEALPGLTVTLSLGTASLSAAETVSAEAALKRADDALYRAKAGGRNRVSAAAPSTPGQA
jgi:diguanylate cyclase (GGDEF)-like protein